MQLGSVDLQLHQFFRPARTHDDNLAASLAQVLSANPVGVATLGQQAVE